jgi:pyruvate carboxylase subunit B
MVVKKRSGKKKISYLCTAFRDGFQSCFGARVLSKDYLPVVAEAVKAGMMNIESGGGAAFQSAFFYNNENAFDVMDKFREICGPNVNLQTLARGVNVVALDSQSSEMIKLHADLFKKHGVTTIRNFDALNDPNNLLYSAECIQKAGLKHQLCVAIMSLPPGAEGAHTPDFYEERLKKFIQAKIPFDSLCFKDASGTSVPSVVYETIRRARKLVGDECSIEFHSHETAGVGLACYLAAVQAGADMVDLSLAPVSGGTCQPDVATMWHALRGTEYELDCDIDAVMRVEEALKEALNPYFLPPEALHADPRIPWSPMPGGALTANTQMLRDNGLMDKYGEIIVAMEEVVRKGGFGTSVTPVSQFYFQQAFNNVMQGPWQKIAEGYGKMVLGYFGKTPVNPDKKVVQIASEQLGLKPTKETVLAINDQNPKKSRDYYESILRDSGLPITDENVFIVASCGDKGIAFLQGKGKIGVRYKDVEKSKTDTYRVIVGGESFTVKLNGTKAEVNGQSYDVSIADVGQDVQNRSSEKTNASQTVVDGVSTVVLAGTPGIVTQILVREGDRITSGQNLCVLEVMKMETFVRASQNGIVKKVLITKGEQVSAEKPVMEVVYDKN